MELNDQLKRLDEKYESWLVLTRQQSVNSSSRDQSSRLNLDMRPSQPSAIAQQLLSRKSVFDEDSKRLEKTSDSSDTPPVTVNNVQCLTSIHKPSTISSPAHLTSSNSPLVSMTDAPCQPSTPTPVPPRDHHPGVSPLSGLSSPIRATAAKVVPPQLPIVKPAVAG